MASEHKAEGNDVVAALREATQGLLYQSETDEPFEVVSWKGEGRALDAKRVLELTGHKPGTPVEVTTLEDFFKELTRDQDWHGPEEKADVRKYRKLEEVLKTQLQNARVYRIGEVNIEIDIVGQTRQGDYAGVRTRAVET